MNVFLHLSTIYDVITKIQRTYVCNSVFAIIMIVTIIIIIIIIITSEPQPA